MRRFALDVGSRAAGFLLLVSLFLSASSRDTSFAGQAATANPAAQVPLTPQQLEFFEKRIRPLLVEHCSECHAAGAKKIKGGLLLDSKAGWLKGGDSGPAIVPGDPDRSLLIRAVRHDDPEFQMPPKTKLSEAQIGSLIEWVKMGAPDPRTTPTTAETDEPSRAAAASAHWAYQPPNSTVPPEVRDASWPRNEIDRFILAKLEAKGLRPIGDADRTTLARRAFYDLIGLPPRPEQLAEFEKDQAADAFPRLVDRLLASQHFGERWGRHWLDVARFGESVTLRGFVFTNAWRYRDYVIESFNEDVPFDRFVREQIAGDLVLAASLSEQQRQMVATTFLVLGNTNFEEQDKKQLEMDVVDEQLDTLGKAFLGQTIGCARCHDHKFDPISTREYYAMAGILHSARTLVHANVSSWIERPLPVAQKLEAALLAQEQRVASLQSKLKEAKQRLSQLASAAGAKDRATPDMPVAVKDLPGLVLDDSQAKRVGGWKHSQYFKSYVGDGYLHDDNTAKGERTLTFVADVPRADRYEVRLAYNASPSRAARVPVNILHADGESVVYVNQRENPPIEGRFVSLGQYRFEGNGQGYVLISNEGTTGHVIVDALQLIPAQSIESLPAASSDTPGGRAAAQERKAADDEVKRLEAELKALIEDGPKRPTFMSVKEAEEIRDERVHIRGSVHNLGELVPRGFLSLARVEPPPEIPDHESGRRELAAWLTARSNPLTARVIVNRVWHWLFGAGLVRTTDNFGTTGEAPSHPDLLDYLAIRFVEEGWSMKQLVRLMVTSRTYQLRAGGSDSAEGRAANFEPAAAEVSLRRHPSGFLKDALQADPENRLLWRMNRKRLDAECIRDALLAVSGELNVEVGGATIRAGTGSDYGYEHKEPRRSVYAPVFRNALPELFQVFDFADPSFVTGQRNASIVSPQALYLLNHPFVRQRAEAAAQRLTAMAGADDEMRARVAYRWTLSRWPTKREVEIALKAAGRAEGSSEAAPRELAWTELFHALFASAEFRYLE